MLFQDESAPAWISFLLFVPEKKTSQTWLWATELHLSQIE